MTLAPETVAKLNELACDFYQQLFPGSPAEEYARSRRLSAETMTRWRFGYAPGGNALLRHLSSWGWPEATLIEAGLARPSERGTVDVFRQRIILPIIDRDGTRILAFGSRRLSDDDPSVPKYLNSPETSLFKKGQTLYGLPNFDDVRAAGEVFLVEGNFDMLALWNAGIRNVMAICGSAVTPEHLCTIAELASKVTLVLDADPAGQKATGRVLLFEGFEDLDLGVLLIPKGPNNEKRDPDDVLADGVEAWRKLLPGRLQRWEYLWHQTLAQYESRLEDDVEARIDLKNEWTALVASLARDKNEGAKLLRRLEVLLGLPEGAAAEEYLADLPDNADVSRDDLLLIALAADWEKRKLTAKLLPLGRGAAAIRDSWLAADLPRMTPRLRNLSVKYENDAETIYAIMRRLVLEPAVRNKIARLTKIALADPGKALAVEVEIARLRAVISN